MPWQIGDTPGEVKLIIPFLNPLMVGKFVYHCHIVGHEDAGMMQNIEVVRPRSTVAELWDGLRKLADNQLPQLWGGSPVLASSEDQLPWPVRRVRHLPQPYLAAAVPGRDTLSAAMRPTSETTAQSSMAP